MAWQKLKSVWPYKNDEIWVKCFRLSINLEAKLDSKISITIEKISFYRAHNMRTREILPSIFQQCARNYCNSPDHVSQHNIRRGSSCKINCKERTAWRNICEGQIQEARKLFGQPTLLLVSESGHKLNKSARETKLEERDAVEMPAVK